MERSTTVSAKYFCELSAAPMERVPALPRDVTVWRINADLWRSVADGRAGFLPKNTQGKQLNRCYWFICASSSILCGVTFGWFANVCPFPKTPLSNFNSTEHCMAVICSRGRSGLSGYPDIFCGFPSFPVPHEGRGFRPLGTGRPRPRPTGPPHRRGPPPRPRAAGQSPPWRPCPREIVGSIEVYQPADLISGFHSRVLG